MKPRKADSRVMDRLDFRRLGRLTLLQAVLVLAGLTAVIYVNSLRNGFVFDDHHLILQNREIQSLAQYPKAFQWDAQRSVPLAGDRGTTHRPLRTALLAVQFHFFGLNPIGYRTINLLLHVLNGSLVFVILRMLFGRPLPAILAAMLFVVHPIQTESVAYISGQRDVLFTTFYLVGFLCFVLYRSSLQVRWLGVAALAYLLGLFSKEMAITLPVLCIAYDLFARLPGDGAGVDPPLSGAFREGIRTILSQQRKLYLLMGLLLALFLFYFVIVSNPSHQRALYGGGIGATLNTSARIVVYYMKQLIFPLTLNADYSYNAFPVSTSVLDPRGIMAALVLAAVAYGLVRLLRTDRWAAFGGLWFFITLLPVSQIIPHHELLAEHFLYLPSVGFCLVVGYAVERALASQRYAVAAVATFAAILVLFGVRSVVRNRDWKDELTLWTKTVQTAPRAARVRLNLAQALRGARRHDQAIEQFKAYSAIEPRSPSGEIGIGDVYRLSGRFDDAIEHFRKALDLSPASAAAAVGLAQAYVGKGEPDKAAEISSHVLNSQFHHEDSYRRLGNAFAAAGLHAQAAEAYRKGIELNRLDVALYTGLGKAFAGLGQQEKALEAYREALKLRPRSPSLRNFIGATHLETGQLDVAIEVLLEAIRLSPDYAEAHNNLGIAYHRLGRRAEAETEFRKALAIQPDSSEFKQNLEIALRRPAEPSLEELERAAREAPNSARAHFNLGSAYGNRGDLARAAQQFQQALQLDPTNPLIHYAMGLLHYQKGDREGARRAWKRAVEVDPTYAPAKERLDELTRAAAAPVANPVR